MRSPAARNRFPPDPSGGHLPRFFVVRFVFTAGACWPSLAARRRPWQPFGRSAIASPGHFPWPPSSLVSTPLHALVPLGSRPDPSPQKHSLSAVCDRHRPTAAVSSRRSRANPSRARQWTLPPSTTAPARAIRSRRSRLHRGEPRRPSSKEPARDHQRLPYRMVPRRGVSGQRGPTPFACGGAQTGGRGNGMAAPDDNIGQSNGDFQR